MAYLPWNHLAASGGDSGDNGSAGVDVPVLVGVLEAAIARSGSSTMDRFSFLGALKLRSIGLMDAWLTGDAGGEFSDVPRDRVRGAVRYSKW